MLGSSKLTIHSIARLSVPLSLSLSLSISLASRYFHSVLCDACASLHPHIRCVGASCSASASHPVSVSVSVSVTASESLVLLLVACAHVGVNLSGMMTSENSMMSAHASWREGRDRAGTWKGKGKHGSHATPVQYAVRSSDSSKST